MQNNKKLLFLSKQIWKGKSVTRAYLNARLASAECVGDTIDIGGGVSSQYLASMKRAKGVEIKTFDLRHGDDVNFETDQLPAADNAFDTVLFLNVMEHIFNYQHIANEVVRITKQNGQVIGFVPFLMWYHPDHSDYFRYTHEALEKIFAATGASKVEIEPIESGPFVAASHLIILGIPRYFRLFIFVPAYCFDALIGYFQKRTIPKYVLGYYFKLTK